MKNLIAAEAKKLSTTRSVYFLLAGVILMAVMSVIDPDHSAATFDKPFHEQTFVFFTSLLTRVLILVLGIRVMSDEFRHGTIVPTFLLTPDRRHVLIAKAITAAVTGAAFALIAWVAMTTAAGAIAVSDGTTLQLDAGAWRSLIGMTAAGAAWGLIGLGLGTLIRSQIVATVGGIVWLMGIEDAVRGWFGDLASYLPGQAGLTLAIAPAPRALYLGATTLALYAALSTVAGAWAVRRDLT